MPRRSPARRRRLPRRPTRRRKPCDDGARDSNRSRRRCASWNRLKRSADAALASADKALAAAKTDEAKARAEDRKQKAAAKAAELATQLDAARADATSKRDAAAAAKDAAKAAETKKAATAKAATEGKLALEPVSIYISRATQKLYVRRNTHKRWPDGGEVFDASIEVPVTIRNPDRPIGTHVFTAMARNAAGLRWTAVTIDEGDDAKDALDRITIPQDLLDRIAPTASPRSSIIVSDEPLSTRDQLSHRVCRGAEQSAARRLYHAQGYDRCPTTAIATTAGATTASLFSSAIGTPKYARRDDYSSGTTGLVAVRRGISALGEKRTSQ